MYNVKYVSKMFGVSEETVRRWIRNGKLKASINSRKKGYIVNKDNLNEFVSNNLKYKKRYEAFIEARKKKLIEKINEVKHILPTLITLETMRNYIRQKAREEA